MKNFLPLLFILPFLCLSAFAQVSSKEGRVEFQKGYKSAAVIEFPYGPDVVERAIKDNLLKQGVKEEKRKGFQVFKGARLSPTDGEVADLYFKVERKSRRESNVSNVYMIVGRPNENVALRTTEDRYRMADGRSFLENMTPSVDAYNLEVSIAEQDKLVEKLEKKLKDLEDDQQDMEKKIRNLEDKIVENRKDQESQRAELSKQRTVSDAMKARRSVTQGN